MNGRVDAEMCRNWLAVVCAVAVPVAVSALLVPFRRSFGPVNAAVVLVAVVVVIAASGFRIAGLIAAASAAFWLDFFLISPHQSPLAGTSAGDFETGFLLFAVGAAVSELAVRGRHERIRAGLAHCHLDLLYEASLRIGSTLDMTRTAHELVQVAVPGLADFVTVDLAMAALRGEEPRAGDSAELRRVASGGIGPDAPLRPVGTLITLVPDVAEESRFFGGPRSRIEPDLRASTAWRLQGPESATMVLDHGIHSLITCPLRAQGGLIGVASFWRSQQSRYQPGELAAAAELALKAAIAIDNGRRCVRERRTALTLQRSLLPQRLDGQAAAEVVSRYLPADSRAGIGGDWFDVIHLSGTRVALVIGDVVGHGIHASATMGRLRTAVRTLADVDLPPGELLTYLDDLVTHLATDEHASAGEDGQAGAGGLGATCLYAVYDPISRQCVLATAGHPLPVLITDVGAAQISSDRIGPPLGVGGMPFETTELNLAPGSVLALFTDGLIESRDRDIDQGLAELCQILAQPTVSLEAAGDAVIDAMRADRPADDSALMLVRTRALPADRVATWDIPADPAMVARAEAGHRAAASVGPGPRRVHHRAGRQRAGH
jgi:serine phosphatase RsbU (regulator of sigma subunit)